MSMMPRRRALALFAGTCAIGVFPTVMPASAATPTATHAVAKAADSSANAVVQVKFASTSLGGTSLVVSSTPDASAAFSAYTTAGTGRLGVHDLVNSAGEHLYVHDGSSELSTAPNYGFTDKGVIFYVPDARGATDVGIIRLYNNSTHAWRYVASEADASTLVQQGWQRDPGERFHGLAPTPVNPSHGSLPVGKASYPAPANAIWVSTTGSDSAAGTQDAPLRTISHAIDVAGSGGTVVVRGGTYHEDAGQHTNTVTVQNAPGEAVWLDGSEQFTNWTASGSTWTTPYSYKFDSGPTFTKGKADYTQASWAFVNASHPMAAHPDEVWVDGVRQTQVDSASKVTSGTFWVDGDNNKLVLGTNPNGHTVKVATLTHALRLEGAGSVMRGIGVRGYATTQYMLGVVNSFGDNVTFENVEIDDPSTVGLGMYRAGDVARNVTIRNAGMLGIMATNDDGGLIDHALVTGSNAQGFNWSPAAAGIKVSRMDRFTLSNSEVDNSNANGFWSDEDSRDLTVSGNVFKGNARGAVMLELSARADVGNNVMVGNATSGNESLFISDTSKAVIHDNIIDGPRAAIRMGQDSRTRSNSPGVGDSRTSPDADMTWHTEHTQILDNVLQNDGGGSGTVADGLGNSFSNWAVIHGQSYSGPKLKMVDAEDGNVVAHPGSGPQFAVVDQQANVDLKGYSTWGAWRSAHPELDANSTYRTTSAVNPDGTLVQGATSNVKHVAVAKTVK